MSCFHPLSALVYGINPENGKKIIRVGALPDGKHESIEIPCGRCIGCRLDYSRQWANRCMLELMDHERACFVTLTYNPEHVLRTFCADPSTGAAYPNLSLYKRDLQLFIKRLRKAFPEVCIRYFGCGEYGPSTFRPHYHLILFGVDFKEDRVPYRKSKTLHPMYTSATLDKLWSFPPRIGEASQTSFDWNALKKSDPEKYKRLRKAGIATVQDVCWETCAYTARYITKKLNGPDGEFYETFNIEKPFAVMSRRPGIGRSYYDAHMGDGSLYSHSFIHLSTPDGGLKFNPPKYFDRLLEEDDPEQYAELKETRKRMAEAVQKAKLASTDLDYFSYLEMSEDVFQSRINTLKRSDL